MKTLARKLVRRDVHQQVGTVQRVGPDGVVVRTDTGEVVAKRATSCLVEPVVGDDVLVASDGAAASFVLAVLERAPGAASTLSVEGDLTVRAAAGKLTFAAQNGVDLVSASTVSIVASALDVNAADATFAMRTVDFLSDGLRARVGKIKLAAESLDAVLERFTQRVKRSYRTVDEIDQVRAERIDHVAKKELSLHAENVLVTAEQLAKVDGEQIHIG